MKLVDAHAHLNVSEFDVDRGQVIKDCLDKGVFVINVGVNYQSSKIAVEIAQQYETGVWVAIGLHPGNIGRTKKEDAKLDAICDDGFDKNLFAELAKSDKVVAVGEIGLDYFSKPKTAKKFEEMKERQITELKKQIAFAREINLPIIFHCRMAHNDLIEILKKEAKDNGAIRGVVHCFTGGVAELEEYLALGLHIGLTGIIYKMDSDEVIKKIPQNRILLETDCPWLSPPGLPQRNEPQNVQIIAQYVAQIRNGPLELLIASANRNAQELFGLAF